MSSLFPASSRLALACTLASALATTPVLAQAPEAAPQETPAASERPVAQSPESLVVAEPAPASKPVFGLGSETYFVNPVLAIAGGLHSENLLLNPNTEKEGRITTLAMARFGFEGRLGPYITFRSEFERNIRNHGSGIWEGTASMSVRDQVVRLQRWGATVEAGIILDPASVDFFSAHIGDVLMADKYTRDPLLYSGFNRGQGVQARYSRWGLTAGFSYVEANPLSTSASFMVGGSFGGNSRFWERPLGNFRNGQPDDDLHFRVLSPSLGYENSFVEAKAMAQVFSINFQTSRKDDPLLNGYNLRGNLKFKLQQALKLPFEVTPFVNVARVENDVLNSAAGYGNQLLDTRFNATTFSGGLDVFLAGRSGVGFNYTRVLDRTPFFVPPTGTTQPSEPVGTTTLSFINVGGTWWLMDQVALGARVAYFSRDIQDKADFNEADLSGFLTLRLVL